MRTKMSKLFLIFLALSLLLSLDRTVRVATAQGPLGGATAVAAAGSHTCALISGGGAKCWGNNNSGQLGGGDGTPDPSNTPVDVIGLSSGVTAIATGGNYYHGHTCALTTDGGAMCWGYNDTGQLGCGSSCQGGNTPLDVIGLSSGVVAITAGVNHTCALTTDGGVKCWGNNVRGELGDNQASGSTSWVPVDVIGLSSGVTAIGAGGLDWAGHTCAVTTDGGVKCWGYNSHGQLGDGTTTHRHTPVPVSELSGVTAIATGGGYHTCALTSGGGVKCWGSNGDGRLGDGTTTDRHTPVDVSGLSSGVTAIAAGENHTCAVTSGGGVSWVKCWGKNSKGCLGNGTGYNPSIGIFESHTPVDVIKLLPIDLSLTKSITPTIAVPGQPITYTLVYSNLSPQLAAGVLITDQVSAGLSNSSYASSGAHITPTGSVDYAWQVENLAPGQGGVITITGMVKTEASNTVFTNTASITSSIIFLDGDQANDSADAAVAVFGFSSPSYTIEENSDTATCTVTIPLTSDTTSTVSYATSNVTAIAGADYLTATGTLTFAPGQNSRTFTVTISDDLLDEEDENVGLTLAAGSNPPIGAENLATLTIVDDDPLPAVAFSSGGFSVDEQAGTALVTATLSAESGKTITVDYTTADGTATAGSDYTATSGTLTFTPGILSRSLNVAILQDTADEPSETFNVTLTNPDNASLGTPSSGTVTIQDDDPLPTVQFGSSTLSVGEAVDSATVTATLSTVSGKTVIVDYATSDGTATGGSDYTASSGTLTFASGQASQTFSVAITQDTIDELDETVTLTLSGPDNATLGIPAAATLIVEDDDPLPTIQFGSSTFSVGEGHTAATITVALSTASGLPITVDYATADATAAAPGDYTSASGSLSFTPAQTSRSFTVSIVDDALNELDETVSLTLRNPSNAVLGTSATLGILDDDPTVTVPQPGDPGTTVTADVHTSVGTVEVTFQNVYTGGTLIVNDPTDPPSGPPTGFNLLTTHFDVTAPDVVFSTVDICFPYNQAEVAAAGIPELSLRLLHFQYGGWQDVTTSLNTASNVICGTVDNLSPFVLGVKDMAICAISINSGARYTAQREVEVFSHTDGAAEMLVSNDAGFSGAQWRSYQSKLPWTLSDLGERIVTLIVYVRLRDSSGGPLCSGVSLSDDIVYDPLAPTVSVTTEATVAGTTSGTGQELDNLVTVHLDASDQQGGSGVAEMQLSTSSSLVGARWQSFSETAQVVAQPGETIYARVKDGAGNVSAVTSSSGSGRVYLPVVLRSP